MKKHVAFAFGRFNPPTIGHKKLIDTVVDAAAGGDFYIFTSQSQDPDKNPLDYQTKVSFLKKLFPSIQDKIVYDMTIKNVLQAADKLKANGYTDATFVCGSDRVPEFTKLLNTWNGMDKTPRFGTLNIVSSGEREDGAENASASARLAPKGHSVRAARFRLGLPRDAWLDAPLQPPTFQREPQSRECGNIAHRKPQRPAQGFDRLVRLDLRDCG